MGVYENMKKIIITITVLLSFIFLVGCLNYKAYDLPSKDAVSDQEISLIEEIAQIEAELKAERQAKEEVVLPELDDDTPAEVNEENMKVVRVKENERISLKPKINDPDGDPITFTFSQPFNDQGVWKTNYGDAGEYTVSLSATDGVLTTTKNIKIIVERVNLAPIIENAQDITVSEGEIVNYIPQVNDPNGDSVSVMVSEPLKSGIFATDHGSSGVYNIKVTASDGELETERTFILTINDVNSVPLIKNLETITIKEGETVTLQPEVSDSDGDQITVTISDPIGDDGIWETSFTDNGEYFITVTASDGKDTVTKTVQVIVENVNVAPEIVDIIVEKR